MNPGSCGGGLGSGVSSGNREVLGLTLSLKALTGCGMSKVG